MRSLLATILLAAFTQFAVASEGGLKLQNANVNLSDQASLQRGAKMFVNYCVSCHSAQYMRYNRVAADLGIPEDVMGPVTDAVAHALHVKKGGGDIGEKVRLAARKAAQNIWGKKPVVRIETVEI